MSQSKPITFRDFSITLVFYTVYLAGIYHRYEAQKLLIHAGQKRDGLF